MDIQNILSLLKGVKRGRNGYTACCPAHDDKHASLSVTTGGDGRILLKCHAGCPTNEIVRALNLEMKDLFAGELKQIPSTEKKIIATYPYKDSKGNLICEKLRYSDKSFAWRQMRWNRWEYTRKGLKDIPLYRLHEITGDTVYLVEGEKDVDTLWSGGLPAVCSPDGAGNGKWKPYMSELLRGKHVIVLQDNDDIGKAFAEEECRALLSITASVKLVDLSILWKPMPDKADVTDFIELAKNDPQQRTKLYQCIKKLAAKTAAYQAEPSKIPSVKKFDFKKFPVQCTANIDFSKTPEVQFYVEDLISEGLSFLTAFSKVGKSRMIMQMLLSICRGTSFLGKETERADVLYCAFEDERIDFENRLKTFLGSAPLPENFYYYTKETFDYATPTLGQDAMLIPLLEHILGQHPTVKVIAIDVFGTIRSKRESGMDFTMHERADIDQLLRLAAKYKIAVIVAHHVSKTGLNADRQNATGSGAGSYVISGSVHAEPEIALDKDDNKRAKFSFKGRRIRSGSLAIRDEYPYWMLEGNWDAVKFSENPVVIMVQWLVEQYGSWIGSAKDFYDENLKSGQPMLIKKPNRKDFQNISDQLKQLGIQYIEHPNGSGGSKHEFRRIDSQSEFIEVDSDQSWEEITMLPS
ncbi:MAG: AAA family ATPase [Eubacteriales bacterium]|nr:AAA family ATPase [Eubacteriales bacterium]